VVSNPWPGRRPFTLRDSTCAEQAQLRGATAAMLAKQDSKAAGSKPR